MSCKYCKNEPNMIIDVTGENDKIDLCWYHAHNLADEIEEKFYELSYKENKK